MSAKKTIDAHAAYVRRVLDESIKTRQELMGQLQRAHELATALERERDGLADRVKELETEAASRLERQRELFGQLESIREENLTFSTRMVELERQASQLANLYVASYQLHGTLDPEEVLRNIEEIVINLVGSEELAVIELGGAGLRVLRTFGVEEARIAQLSPQRGPLRRACEKQEAVLGEPGEAVTACIPLHLEGEVRGAIVIWRLLGQKPGIEPSDLELFDLLATHAATALRASGALRDAA